jgi:hypothetical protein
MPGDISRSQRTNTRSTAFGVFDYKAGKPTIPNTPKADDLYLHKAPLAVGESIGANGYTIKHISTTTNEDTFTIVRN